MFDLTSFQRDILFVVAGMDKPKGLAIKAELEENYGKDVNHGRLYPNLDTLVKAGLLEKGQKDRRTNEYRLSSKGKHEIKERSEWESSQAAEVLA